LYICISVCQIVSWHCVHILLNDLLSTTHGVVLFEPTGKLTEDMNRQPPLPIYTLKGDMAAVNCLDYISPDLLCAGTTEGKMHIWNLTVSIKLLIA